MCWIIALSAEISGEHQSTVQVSHYTCLGRTETLRGLQCVCATQAQLAGFATPASQVLGPTSPAEVLVGYGRPRSTITYFSFLKGNREGVDLGRGEEVEEGLGG